MAVTSPIFRVFDYAKTVGFYIDWLGFQIDFIHQFEPEAPRYLQISMRDLVFHLSEHHGDGVPGGRAFIRDFKGVREYHASLMAKKYKYNRPALEIPFWDDDSLQFIVDDPFGNRIAFTEQVNV